MVAAERQDTQPGPVGPHAEEGSASLRERHDLPPPTFPCHRPACATHTQLKAACCQVAQGLGSGVAALWAVWACSWVCGHMTEGGAAPGA